MEPVQHQTSFITWNDCQPPGLRPLHHEGASGCCWPSRAEDKPPGMAYSGGRSCFLEPADDQGLVYGMGTGSRSPRIPRASKWGRNLTKVMVVNASHCDH